MVVEVVQAVSDVERAQCRALRYQVFVQEQAVPPELEVDGLDDECQHFLARSSRIGSDVGSEALATARARATGRGWKIERVAVARGQRGRAIGAALVRHILAQAPRGLTVYVHAQEGALGFWQRMGFAAEGPGFVEGGIQHRVMLWSESPAAR